MTKKRKPIIRRPHHLARKACLIAFTAFIISLIWEKWGGDVPCAFCLIERAVCLIGAIITGLASLSREPIVQRLLLVGAFVWACGAVVTFQHVGVQYHWFRLPSFCKVSEPSGTSSAQELAQQLLQTPVARCDRITKTFLGQPPAAYLFLLMMSMVVMCFFGATLPSLQEEIDRHHQLAEEHREWELEHIRQREIHLGEQQQKKEKPTDIA